MSRRTATSHKDACRLELPFPVIDGHCHLAGEELAVEGLIEAMDRDGISRTVLMAKTMPWCPELPHAQLKLLPHFLTGPLAPIGRRQYRNSVKDGRIKVGGQWVEIIRSPDNREVAEAVRRYPDRLIGFVFLNPQGGGDMMATLRHYVEEEGFRGVKFNAWWHELDIALELGEVAEYCQQNELPILIHLGERPSSSNVTGLLKRFAKLTVILAHGAIPHFGFYWPLIRKYDNLYTDLSGDFVKKPLAGKIIRKVGSGKAIWGTDGPYGLRNRDAGSAYHHTFRHEMAKVDGLGLSDEDLRSIFSGNLFRILQLDE